MTDEEELAALKAKLAFYTARRGRHATTTKVVFIMILFIGVVAFVYSLFQAQQANNARMVAENFARETRELEKNKSEELSNCANELEQLRVQVTKCRNQPSKK